MLGSNVRRYGFMRAVERKTFAAWWERRLRDGSEFCGMRNIVPDLDGLFTVHSANLGVILYEDSPCDWGTRGRWTRRPRPRVAAPTAAGATASSSRRSWRPAAGGRLPRAHHQAVVGGEGPTNHMVPVVDLDGESWVADAGLGEGSLDPLPLRAGPSSAGPFRWTREPEAWERVDGQHEWRSLTGIPMDEEECRRSSVFERHHRRLASDTSSPFVKQTLGVRLPHEGPESTMLWARTPSSGRAGRRPQAGGVADEAKLATLAWPRSPASTRSETTCLRGPKARRAARRVPRRADLPLKPVASAIPPAKKASP